jgi:hypothetical protein
MTQLMQSEVTSLRGDPRAYEKQGARLIGFVLGGSLVLIMALYSMVL